MVQVLDSWGRATGLGGGQSNYDSSVLCLGAARVGACVFVSESGWIGGQVFSGVLLVTPFRPRVCHALRGPRFGCGRAMSLFSGESVLKHGVECCGELWGCRFLNVGARLVPVCECWVSLTVCIPFRWTGGFLCGVRVMLFCPLGGYGGMWGSVYRLW